MWEPHDPQEREDDALLSGVVEEGDQTEGGDFGDEPRPPLKPERAEFEHTRFGHEGSPSDDFVVNLGIGITRTCPQKDSDLYWTDFETVASTSWAMGAKGDIEGLCDGDLSRGRVESLS